MTSNNRLTSSSHDDTGSGTAFETCTNRSARRDEAGFQIIGGDYEYGNDEPKLPKGYRHIHSAIEAVLECSGEHISG